MIYEGQICFQYISRLYLWILAILSYRTLVGYADHSNRNPLQPPSVLDLAAASAPEIATLIFRSILFLKPQWLDYTFLYGGPPEILDDSDSPIPSDDDNGLFDKTLVAYCMAYNVS